MSLNLFFKGTVARAQGRDTGCRKGRRPQMQETHRNNSIHHSETKPTAMRTTHSSLLMASAILLRGSKEECLKERSQSFIE